MNILYKTSATSTGGRDGRSISADGILDVKLATPKALGDKAAKQPTLSSCLQRVTRPALSAP